MEKWFLVARRTVVAAVACLGMVDVAGAQGAPPETAAETERWRREVRDCDVRAEAQIKAGRLRDALGWAETAVRLCDLTPGMPSAEQAQSSALLASILERLGRRREAIASYRKAMVKHAADPQRDLNAVSSQRRSLAVLLYDQGSVEEARVQARLAFLTDAGGKDPRTGANELSRLAAWLTESRDREAAETTYLEALKLLSKQPAAGYLVERLELELGMLFQSARRYADAEAAFRRELASAKQLTDKSKVAMAQANIGAVLLRSGRCGEAHRALAEALTGFGSNHPSMISTRELFALALVCEGDSAAAVKQLGLVSSVFRAPASRSGPVYARFLDTTVAVVWSTGDVDATLRLLPASNQARKAVTTSLLQSGTDATRRSYLEFLQGRVNTILSFALTDARSSPQAAAAGYDALIDFKGRLLELTIEQTMARQRSASGVLDSMSTVQSRMDEIARLLHAQDPQVALRDVPAVSLQSIQGKLRAKDALVEFALYTPSDPRKLGSPAPDARYAAFVLRGQGPPRAVDLGSAADIDRQVAQALGALVSKSPTYAGIAEGLHTRVFAPLTSLFGDAVNLYIAPDAELNLLPFAALADANHQYLVKRFQITYLTSGRDLLRITHRIVPRSPPRLFAAPNYDAGQRSSTGVGTGDSLRVTLGLSPFDPLKHTLTEVKALGPILDGPRKIVIYTGAEATESAFKSLHAPSILHVATHGFYADGSMRAGTVADGRAAKQSIKSASAAVGTPLVSDTLPPLQRSGLALAGANRDVAAGDDGIVTAAEVLAMDLQGTQLVTLSACNTARGKTSVGEGVWGLRRAFAAAGAETQMITLWRVDDRPTVATMKNFYTRLKKGEGRSAALRSTQLDMIGQHPYYWASFVVAGDPSPMHDSIIMPSISD